MAHPTPESDEPALDRDTSDERLKTLAVADPAEAPPQAETLAGEIAAVLDAVGRAGTGSAVEGETGNESPGETAAVPPDESV